MLLKRTYTVFVVLASLSGCSYISGDVFKSTKQDYQQSNSTQVLKVPDGLNNETLNDKYPVTPVSMAGYTLLSEVPKPDRLVEGTLTNNINIININGQSLLVIAEPPATVWAQTLRFLNEQNYLIESTELKRGVINYSTLDKRERYRLSLATGMQSDASNISIEPIDGGFSSISRLKKLADFLKTTSGSGDSLIAQSIGGPAKAKLVTQNNQLVISSSASIQRLIVSVDQALTMSSLQRYDADLERALFYIDKPVSEEDKPGWFARWFLFNRVNEGSPYLLEDFEREPFKAQGAKNTLIPGYLLSIDSDQGVRNIRLKPISSGTIDIAIQRKILKTLHQHML